jgi:carbonic anhydrase
MRFGRRVARATLPIAAAIAVSFMARTFGVIAVLKRTGILERDIGIGRRASMRNRNGKLPKIAIGFFVAAIVIVAAAKARCDDTLKCNEARPPSADAALKALADGNARWSTGKMTHSGRDFARRECVSREGQTPFAAILACADSRVPPELIFDEGVGDLFVVRVAGNSVDKLGEQSLAYATEHLGVETILVLGHQNCGAVKAAVAAYPKPTAEFLAVIYDAIAKAKDVIHQRGGNPDDKDELAKEATDQHVILEVKHLRELHPFKEMIADGKLKIVGGRYDLDTSKVVMLIE